MLRMTAEYARTVGKKTGATKNKYGVKIDRKGKAARTVDGIQFDSKREAKRYSELRMLERAREISALRLQVPFPLVVNGELICIYRADFVYVDKAGATVVEDAKGFATKDYKLKRKLMKALYRIEVKEV